MYIEQFYTRCLSEAAYYIESDGQAAIIDPLRETEAYLNLAAKRKATIRYIFETHFHSDFVSGHLDLARNTNARIVYGPGASAEYIIYVAKDEEDFALGNCKIKVLYTPGHSLESVSYLLLDENDHPKAVFTGDSLWLSSTRKPQITSSGEYSRPEMAGKLYESLYSKILQLPENVLLFPGHGSTDDAIQYSTIAEQVRKNPLLRMKDKNSFVAAMLAGLDEPEAQNLTLVDLNKKGYESIRTILNKATRPLSPDDFEKYLSQGVTIIDTRASNNFATGFIPGSINLGIDGPFANWAARLLDLNKQYVFVADEGREQEVIIRFARVGIENIAGYLKGGFYAWQDTGKKVQTIRNVVEPGAGKG